MIIPVNYGQANLIYGGNGYTRGAQVAIGFHNVGAADPGDLAAVLVSNYLTTIAPVVGSACRLNSVKVKLGPNDTGPEATVSAGIVGSLGTNTLPPNVCVLMNKITATGGRKNKGKSNWPGATEDQTDGGGLLTTGALSDWVDAVQAFFDQMVTDDMPMFVLHSDATTPTEVTAVIVQQLVSQQHRRLRRTSGHRTSP